MKVAILMSTYNGEAFLGQQIDSIISQSFKDWKLYIRDDGSTDATIKIIKEYCIKDNRINFIHDNFKRLGPKRSFFALLKQVDADYYFFSDQDDVWKKEKISILLDNFSHTKNCPQVIYSGLQCTDQNLNPIEMSANYTVGRIKGNNRFICNDASGCTMAFNHKTKEYFLKGDFCNPDIIMHDWWIVLIAEAFGKVIFVDKQLIYYRQHQNNTVGAGTRGNIVKKILQSDLIRKQSQVVKETLKQSLVFKRSYGDLLDTTLERFLIDLIACQYNNFIFRMKFLNKNNIRSISWGHTMSYRFFLLFLASKFR